MGKVIAVCTSDRRGIQKQDVQSGYFAVDWGIDGDAHAGHWHRQVSLLADEAVERMRAKGLELHAGDFAENVLVSGMDLKELPVGTVLDAGTARLAVTQIGKTCHNDCEIRRLTGMCVMPTDGIFCIVIRSGALRAGDTIRIVPEDEA